MTLMYLFYFYFTGRPSQKHFIHVYMCMYMYMAMVSFSKCDCLPKVSSSPNAIISPKALDQFLSLHTNLGCVYVGSFPFTSGGSRS